MNAFHPEPRPDVLVWRRHPSTPAPLLLRVVGWVEARDFDVKGGENLLIPVTANDTADMREGWVERALDHERVLVMPEVVLINDRVV
jgi:hypothetical protein